MEIFTFPKSRVCLKQISALLLLCFCVSCSAISTTEKKQVHLIQMVPDAKEKHRPFVPVFLVENPEEPYNKIGSPKVGWDARGDEIVFVDSTTAAIFEDLKKFTTAKGESTNLIYRVHFEKVPWALDEIHLTAGKNVGLLIIYTINAKGQMVLLTTVHTCGCFLAFFPTEHLSVDALPDNWPKDRQNVYQQVLPAFIQAPRQEKNERVLIRLENATHRVAWVEVKEKPLPAAHFVTAYMQRMDMDKLWHLPFENREASFFEMNGFRQGYVRNNFKPFERLLLSWLALDLYVGEDKAYGYQGKSNTVFYTSLKFWQRNDSDMEDFARFLKYWGWRL